MRKGEEMTEIAESYVDLRTGGDASIPRIQILELPLEHVGDYVSTPFAVVIDGVPPEQLSDFSEASEGIAAALEARATLVFQHRVRV